MIFYGSRSTKLKEGRINNVNCKDCEELTTYSYVIFGKYAHLYWIPFFPMKKQYVIECDNCGRTYKAKNLPKIIYERFNKDYRAAKSPLWNYSGLAVLGVLISLAFYQSNRHAENNLKYINDPKVGDVYATLGSENGYYTSAKVIEITNDSVYVVFSDYEVDKKHKTYKVDKASNYTDNTAAFSKKDLILLFDEETIYNVNRE
jgi:ribosomal protein S27E